MLLKSMFSLVVLLSSYASSAWAASCRVNVYYSDTLIPDSWRAPRDCGAPEWKDKSVECTDRYIDEAKWKGSNSLNFSGKTAYISQGYLAYFLLEYNAEECEADFKANRNFAYLIGKTKANNKTQLLYAALGSNDGITNRLWNLIVFLNNGIEIRKVALEK